MPPRVPSPMMATPAPALPAGDGWSYEVKWDGYRTLALKDGPRVRLFSRNLKDVTAAYPSVVRTLGELKAPSAAGRRGARGHRRGGPAVVSGAAPSVGAHRRVLRVRPAADRRPRSHARAAGRCADSSSRPRLEGTSILVSEPLPGTPAQIERAVRELGLRASSPSAASSRYEAGRRSDAWLKVNSAAGRNSSSAATSRRTPGSTRCSSATTIAGACTMRARSGPASRRTPAAS